MPIPYFNSIDLQTNELLNARVQNLAAAPSTFVKGQIYYNTGTNKLMINKGDNVTADWQPCEAGGEANATHTGDVTGSAALSITAKAVTNSKLNDMAAATIKGNKTAGIGPPADLTSTEVRTLINVADGANNYSHPNHSGDVTSSGDGAQTIAAGSVTNAKMANMVQSTFKGRKTASTGAPEDMTVAEAKALLALVKSDVGLSNVTNDAQVKKLASSTSGKVPTWNGATGDALNDGYEVETTLAGSASKLARADAIKAYIDNAVSGVIGAADAMVFKGILDAGNWATTAALTTYNAGWTYRASVPGTFRGQVCQIGDLIIAITDRTGTGSVDADWTVVQANIDGSVTGPASATDSYFPLFDGTTGKILKNSAYAPASFAAASHAHGTFDNAVAALSGAVVYSDIDITDGLITGLSTRSLTPADVGATKKYSAAIGNGALTTIPITHNLNTRDVVVMVRETAGSYQKVECAIEMTDANTVTLKFSTAPTANQFTVTVIG